ncbi:MAG: hypothetical protein AB1403_02080 [Candidatus Riflebacteria bacterium]
MKERKGNAGTIMVVMIMGFLMTVTTAYMKMVQTENLVRGMIDHSDRALDAAFSGVQYAMSVAQAKQDMFINSTNAIKQRFYFISSTHTTDWDYTASSPLSYPYKLESDWFFNDGAFNLMEIHNDINKPYVFRVTSYASHTASLLIPSEYIIKSQGKFIEYSDDNSTVINEYKAQVIALVQINFTRKVLKLKAWRQMQFQDDANFFGIDHF